MKYLSINNLLRNKIIICELFLAIMSYDAHAMLLKIIKMKSFIFKILGKFFQLFNDFYMNCLQVGFLS